MPNPDTITKIKSIDLKAYLEQHTTFKRKFSSRHGGGFMGPCPICGGDDRFRVYPAMGICHCRQCSPSTRWEDIISITSRMRGTSFPETCEYLQSVADGLPVVNLLELEGAASQDPSPEWRQAGEEVVRQCHEALWSDEGAAVRQYLQEKRLLTEESLRKWHLGLSVEQQVIAGLKVPKGIVIPWFFEGELWHLKVRVNPATYGTKYLSIHWQDPDRKEPGGVPIIYGAETLERRDLCVVCEGEFDAMLLHQEAGDLVAVITNGTCKDEFDLRVIPCLLPMRRIYIAYDTDPNEAGQKAAARLEKTSEKAKSVRLSWGKDITEFQQQGGDLREWVRSFLESTDPPLPICEQEDIPEEPDEAPSVFSGASSRDELAGDGSIIVLLQSWNRAIYGKNALRVSRDPRGSIRCEFLEKVR